MVDATSAGSDQAARRRLSAAVTGVANPITVGIDLAKNVFAVHGVDESGKAALVKPKVSRAVT